jgi:hypothetical protein
LHYPEQNRAVESDAHSPSDKGYRFFFFRIEGDEPLNEDISVAGLLGLSD